MAIKSIRHVVKASRYEITLDKWRKALIEMGCRPNSIVYSTQRRIDLLGAPFEVVMQGETNEYP